MLTAMIDARATISPATRVLEVVERLCRTSANHVDGATGGREIAR
jgi:hypothetical protein